MSSIKEGRVIAARYQLERPLAKGGMGSVWVARHLQLETTVAIKFIEPTLAALPEARGRFEREAKVAAQLQGPNLVQIHDYGIEDDTPYMVMECLHGEDLSARLNRETRLSHPAAVSIVSQVATVLRRAHEAGIIHRDLKPGNIFLVRGDEDEEIVKVLDFGLAKIPRSTSGDEMTKTGMLLGSPRYMSPEQARGLKTIDHRSDLWSLAVIAFRAITGALPFPGDEIGDVLVKICADPAPAPSTILPELSPAVDRFFARAFEHDPSQRFQSARELARAFTAAVEGRPPSLVSAPALLEGAPPIDAMPAAPELVEPSRTAATLDDSPAFTPSTGEIQSGARLSWIGTPHESLKSGNLSSILAGPHRRRRSAGAAAAILGSCVVLIVYAMFAKGSTPLPAVPSATAILPEATAEAPSSPVVVAVAPPATASVSASRPSPNPPISPPSRKPAGATSAAAPLPAPKPPSSKQRNLILGI
jgi:serine/threonine-protein kinase